VLFDYQDSETETNNAKQLVLLSLISWVFFEEQSIQDLLQ